MAVFKYHATDSDRSAINGVVAAETPRQARDILRSRGLVVQHVKESRQPLWRGNPLAWLPGRSSGQWAMSVHELAMLLRAGIPLLDALDTIARQHRGTFRTAIVEVRDRVAAGSSLTDALAERPEIFDSMSIHLVEVGENSGTLEQVLDELGQFKQRQLQLKDQVFTALMYPMFLVVFGTAATVFLMTYVLPPLLENLQESLVTLPWPTRVVKGCSDLLIGYGPIIGGGLALGVIAAAVAVRTTTGRRWWHRVLLRLPLVGSIALRQSISRSAMVISTLIRSGVVLTKALELAARSSDNMVIRDAMERAGRRVAEGRDVADALRHVGVFPPLAVQIFSVGQESGRLEELLDRLSSDYNRQVATVSARLTSMLEPVLILVLAGLVGFVLLATILPILEAGDVL